MSTRNSNVSRTFWHCAVLVLLFLPAASSPAQDTTQTIRRPTGLCFELRSILVDGVVSPLSLGVSGAIDVDVVRIPSSNDATFGLRLGIDRYVTGNPGGDDPRLDYDVFIRHTASGKDLRFDLYFGFSYFTHTSQGGVKLGVDFRFKLAQHFLSLLGKLSAPLGLGFSAGWDR